MSKVLSLVLFSCVIPACSENPNVAEGEQATTGVGTTSTLVGRGTFSGPFKLERKDNPAWGGVDFKAFDDVDIAVQTITFNPGGKSGWHSHPGPVFITVKSGTMTFYSSEDPNCAPVVVSAPNGFLDGGGPDAHIAVNQSGSPAVNVVVYVAPPGAALRIDAPQPANCPTL
jgi:quercetin dioxygenase-like cupin family protein